jgi:integrase
VLRIHNPALQRALYTTLALTGLRPSEALALYWEEHVDYERRRILVRQQLRNDGTVDPKLKTQRSERDVVMLEPVRVALRALAPQIECARGSYLPTEKASLSTSVRKETILGVGRSGVQDSHTGRSTP